MIAAHGGPRVLGNRKRRLDGGRPFCETPAPRSVRQVRAWLGLVAFSLISMEATAVKKGVGWMLVCLAALVLVTPAAQAEGWSWKKLNPFAKSSASAKKKKSSGLTSWKMPKLRTPAPIQKVNRGTTRMASKTWDALTFWDNEDKSTTPAWGGGAKPYKRKSEEKESWFGSLFSAKDERPKDPNDFLRQKRPE